MPEVIPELVFVVGLFFAVVGYLAARGILATWTHSIGYLLEALAGKLHLSIPTGIGHINIDFGGPVRSIDNFVVTALQNWSAGAEIEMAYCLHGMTKVALYTSQAIDYLARESAATFDWLVGIHLPKWSRSVIAPAALGALIAKMIADALRKVIPKVDHVAHAVAHAATVPITRVVTIPHLGELQWIHRHWKAITAAAAAAGGLVLAPGLAIPRLWRGIGHAETEINRLTKRISRTEALLGAAAMAAVMANVLGVSSRCLRSGNVGKVARHLCGLNSSWLNALLGLTVAVGGTISIVELAKANQKILPGVIDGLGFLIDETPDAFRAISHDVLAEAAALIPGI